ncbi:MAG: hypothetical protein Q8K98_08705 [Bacteroidota bacterium]|nr:hypothetical protein [Bacteroidota bacterium]
MINEQIEALSRIASEFSNFARMPERKPTACNIGEVLKEAVQLFTKYENVEFILEIKDNELNINADREELRRAFINIIRNSIQAMNERGALTVSAKIIDRNVQLGTVFSSQTFRQKQMVWVGTTFMITLPTVAFFGAE